MSLYNMIHGVNPLAGMLLSILDLTPERVGRFRDCFLAKHEENGDLEIHVYTRNGGGNRECYREDEPTFNSPECNCQACITRFVLPKHPAYLRDFDSDYDSTYATIAFRIPEGFKGPLMELVAKDESAVPPSPGERFRVFMEKMEKQGVEDPDVARVVGEMKPVFDQIMKVAKE